MTNLTPPPAEGWVTMPDGAILPADKARDTGWQDDRDQVNTAQVTWAREAVERGATRYRLAAERMRSGVGGDMVSLMTDTIIAADELAAAWACFAEVTGGAQ